MHKKSSHRHGTMLSRFTMHLSNWLIVRWYIGTMLYSIIWRLNMAKFRKPIRRPKRKRSGGIAFSRSEWILLQALQPNFYKTSITSNFKKFYETLAAYNMPYKNATKWKCDKKFKRLGFAHSKFLVLQSVIIKPLTKATFLQRFPLWQKMPQLFPRTLVPYDLEHSFHRNEQIYRKSTCSWTEHTSAAQPHQSSLDILTPFGFTSN